MFPMDFEQIAHITFPTPWSWDSLRVLGGIAWFEWLTRLTDTSGFPARWHCGIWTALHGWLHIVSDLAIWIAYVAIPCALFYFIRRRPDVPFPRIFWLFCGFILACGLTHLMEALMFWWPAYRLMGVIKAATGVVSLMTVAFLIPIIPRALHLPGLKRLNDDLSREIASRRRAESHLRQVIDQAPNGMFLVNAGGTVTFVNQHLATLFGIPREELLGRPLNMLFPPRVQSGVSEALERAMGSDQTHTVGVDPPAYAVGKDGHEFPVELRLSSFDTAEERLTLGSIEDITERKSAEHRRIQRQKDESVTLLAGGIAHDFNNLLVATIGNASLLADQSETGTSERALADAIINAGERMADLSRQLLAYARGGKYHTKVMNLSDAVLDVLQLSKGLKPDGVDIDVSCPRGLWCIEADPAQISQVLLNLCVNAFEAMSGVGRLTLSVANVEREAWQGRFFGEHPAGKYVCLTVSDTGKGMTRETQERLFDPFFSTKGIGRGLGLAAVAGIVRNHGGAAEVHSLPGQGCTFEVWFPAVEAAAPSAVPPAREWAPKPESANVLLIEDESAVRFLVTKVLETVGCSMIVATDGPSGVAKFQTHKDMLDLVLLDLRLPGFKGDEVFRLITQISREVPIVVCSGYDEQAIPEWLRKHPQFAGFLPKPFGPTQLLESVRATLATRRARAQQMPGAGNIPTTGKNGIRLS